MNGLSAFLQQALSVAGTQATALWNVTSAIAANRSAPARQVVIYTLALAVLAFVVPKLVSK